MSDSIQRQAAGADETGTGLLSLNDQVLVTGANGFIGTWVVRHLLARGFTRIRCLTRGGANLEHLREGPGGSAIEVLCGNLLSPETCERAAQGVVAVYHLAAGVEKTFPGCFLNSVITTRNLLEAVAKLGVLRRFVNTSSLAVYANGSVRWGGIIDESCPLDTHLVERHDPYAYGKAKQDELVRQYGRERALPYVIVRPGVTFGPGKAKIPGRIGIDTFGVFLHLGLGHLMPFTYVENCAEAIVLAGLTPGIDREEINLVDDDLPSSRAFLRRYKREVQRIRSIPVPYAAFYLFNAAWERYSRYSGGQLPPVFNRLTCAAYYKSHGYSNRKAKSLLGWTPQVSMTDALGRFFAYARSHRASG